MFVRVAQRVAERLQPLFPARFKGRYELAYWRWIRRREGTLTNHHFEAFFTTWFGIARAEYDGLRVLDVGCGPRGSLEWAENAAERVGLDPLAAQYLTLGAADHDMRYVAASAEAMPFEDGRFDVVASFNSLDHVDDLDGALREIARVTRPGGRFLLITDVGHRPTPTEPQAIGWDLLTSPVIAEAFDVLRRERLERSEKGVYESVRRAVPYDDGDSTHRHGVLKALLVRKPATEPR